jgi:histidinol phosphatase-like enzyme
MTHTTTLPAIAELIIVNCDGSLVVPASGEVFRDNAEDWQWLPGRREALETLSEQGYLTAMATNQGGVPFYHLKQRDLIRELWRMCIEGRFNTMRVCYSHPFGQMARLRREDSRRKPGPDMLLEIRHSAPSSSAIAMRTKRPRWPPASPTGRSASFSKSTPAGRKPRPF